MRTKTKEERRKLAETGAKAAKIENLIAKNYQTGINLLTEQIENTLEKQRKNILTHTETIDTVWSYIYSAEKGIENQKTAPHVTQSITGKTLTELKTLRKLLIALKTRYYKTEIKTHCRTLINHERTLHAYTQHKKDLDYNKWQLQQTAEHMFEYFEKQNMKPDRKNHYKGLKQLGEETYTENSQNLNVLVVGRTGTYTDLKRNIMLQTADLEIQKTFTEPLPAHVAVLPQKTVWTEGRRLEEAPYSLLKLEKPLLHMALKLYAESKLEIQTCIDIARRI